jgi:hypothetical protein
VISDGSLTAYSLEEEVAHQKVAYNAERLGSEENSIFTYVAPDLSMNI